MMYTKTLLLQSVSIMQAHSVCSFTRLSEGTVQRELTARKTHYNQRSCCFSHSRCRRGVKIQTLHTESMQRTQKKKQKLNGFKKV